MSVTWIFGYVNANAVSHPYVLTVSMLFSNNTPWILISNTVVPDCSISAKCDLTVYKPFVNDGIA